jgi:hypothetical protein
LNQPRPAETTRGANNGPSGECRVTWGRHPGPEEDMSPSSGRRTGRNEASTDDHHLLGLSRRGARGRLAIRLRFRRRTDLDRGNRPVLRRAGCRPGHDRTGGPDRRRTGGAHRPALRAAVRALLHRPGLSRATSLRGDAGAIFGAVFGALAHSAMGGSRDFASVARTEAERYEVQVDEEVPMRPKSSSTPCLPRSPERPAHRPCSANGGSAVEHRMPGPDLDLPRCGHADRLCQRLGDALGR